MYVIRSLANPDRHYVGLTSNVSQRLCAHNGGGVQHTSANRAWELVASFEFATERVAARFEKYLKRGSGRAFAKRHFG